MRGRPNPSRRGAGRAETPNRRQLVFEAARIMAIEGVRDFQLAKRKALERLALPANRDLPSNEEIAEELAHHLHLFHGPRLARTLSQLRASALEAMRLLAPFTPRLVGPVLTGVVTPDSGIQLHLTADTPEEVALFLDERAIPSEQSVRRMRYGDDRHANIPTYRFTAGDTSVELFVFDPRAVREPPLCPVDGRPIKRAGIQEVESLLG